MKVYIETLFVENFVTGWIILLLTGKLRGCTPCKWRIAAGAVMCGTYAFILFVPLHWMTALAGKLLFSAAVVIVVFGGGPWRSVVKNAGVFYIVSFLMGGVTIAIMYMLKIPGMTGNGSFVLKGAKFLQIAAGVAATWYLGSWLAGILHEKITKSKLLYKVTIELGEHCWNLKGLVDTGNSLADPVTGKKVAVLSKKAAEDIYAKLDAADFKRISVIPYKTVNGPGVMYGIRPDHIFVDGMLVTDLVLGCGDREFAPWKGTEKYDLLLHQQFFEGEEQKNG